MLIQHCTCKLHVFTPTSYPFRWHKFQKYIEFFLLDYTKKCQSNRIIISLCRVYVQNYSSNGFLTIMLSQKKIWSLIILLNCILIRKLNAYAFWRLCCQRTQFILTFSHICFPIIFVYILCRLKAHIYEKKK